MKKLLFLSLALSMGGIKGAAQQKGFDVPIKNETRLEVRYRACMVYPNGAPHQLGGDIQTNQADLLKNVDHFGSISAWHISGLGKKAKLQENSIIPSDEELIKLKSGNYYIAIQKKAAKKQFNIKIVPIEASGADYKKEAAKKE